MPKQAATMNTVEDLLKRELAAVDTYRNAVMHSNDVADKAALEQLRRDHGYAANALRNLLARMHDPGGVDDAGAWGTFARATEDVAYLLGRRATIKALRAGEVHGIKRYRRALDDGEVAPEAKALIGAKLLPRCHAHLDTLDTMAHVDHASSPRTVP